MVSLADIRSGAERHRQHRRSQKAEYERNFINAEYFVVFGQNGGAPLIEPVGWALRALETDGLKAHQAVQTSTSKPLMKSLGLKLVEHGTKEHELLWKALLAWVEKTNLKQISKRQYVERQSRTFFWVDENGHSVVAAKDLKRDHVINAMAAFSRGDRPHAYGQPRGWHVVNPQTGEPFPLKGIFGLATGRSCSKHDPTGFRTNEAKAVLEQLDFNCIDTRATCRNPPVYPDDLPDDRPHTEGLARQVVVNRHERSGKARRACIAHYREKDGAIKCQACDLIFETRYGELGAGFIHVHHIVPLNQITARYEVDPVKDLIPLCPNCHAMIHRLPEGKNSVETLSALLAGNE